MSLSNPTVSKNPAKKFLEFKSDLDCFQFYDKEKKENIKVELPVEFIVLDELATIKGWNDASNSGVFSNEVHDTTMEELVVRSKGGEIAKGVYNDIKDKLKADGGRYAKSVYALLDGELVKFTFIGSALSAWIEKDFNAVGVKVEKTIEGKKGSNTYRIPVFEEVEIKKEDIEKAKEVDADLQTYFTSKKIAKRDEEVVEKQNEEAKKDSAEQPTEPEKQKEEVKIDDLPF